MKTQFKTLTSLVVAAALAVAATPAEAGKIKRLVMQNGLKGVESPVKPTAQKQQEARDSVTRFSGKLAVNSRTGLTMGRHALKLTPATQVFPAIGRDGSMPDPSRLSGKFATVIGKRTRDGVEVSLLILNSSRVSVNEPMDRAFTKQSAADANVGVYIGGAPD